MIGLASRLTAKHHLDRDGRYGGRFRSRLDRPSGTAVILVGDPRNTVRWIRDDRLVETEFDFLGRRRHVAVLATASASDGRWLPAVTMEHDVRSEPDGCREVIEEWAEVDGIVLPRRRTVISSGPDRHHIDIEVRDHRLTNPGQPLT